MMTFEKQEKWEKIFVNEKFKNEIRGITNRVKNFEGETELPFQLKPVFDQKVNVSMSQVFKNSKTFLITFPRIMLYSKVLN